jgi:hypothetical protein
MPRKVTTNNAPDAAASAAASVQVETMLPVRKRPAKSATQPEKPSQKRSRARVPRITRLMALAIKFQDMIERGEVRDYADIARLGYVTRARVTQIMNLMNLAPDIQEEIMQGEEWLSEYSAIENSGLHFAMLGHYHSPRDEARFTYPRNPEPLTFGESGNRGAVIVTVTGDGSVTLDRRRVAVTDVADLDVDFTGCTSKQEIRARVAEVLANRRGYARVQLSGELGTDIDIQAFDFGDLILGLDAPPLVRFGAYSVAYNLAEINQEPTVRGQFIRDVQASGLPADERQRIIITGLRALDGRTDLAVM